MLRKKLQRVSSLNLFNHEKHVAVQTIISCISSPFVSSSVIVAQLIIFLILSGIVFDFLGV